MDRRRKLPSLKVVDAYEAIYEPECEQLVILSGKYPVTLMYLPLEWCSQASNYCEQLFGGRQQVNIDNCLYGILYSNQDKAVTSMISKELKESTSRVRLVFCTSSVGMGFDAKGIERVIHGKPPRSLSDYFQQIGRCGRAGQKSIAILYYNASDIARNIRGIQPDVIDYCVSTTCLREVILETFGFSKGDSSPTGCQCCCVCKETCTCDKCVKLRDTDEEWTSQSATVWTVGVLCCYIYSWVK